MASVEENLKAWQDYDWPRQGEEWSAAWGSTQAMWDRSIWPRIKYFLPAHNVLEIACGMGRCSTLLAPHCAQFTGIDIVDKCLDACRQKLPKNVFLKTDGKTIPLLDNSVDFIFSWDSLVHCDFEVIKSYLAEIKRVLRVGGFAFVHHSNWGDRPGDNSNTGWRAKGVKAWDVNVQAVLAGLSVEVQEIVSWGQHQWSDAFTTMSKPEGQAAGKTGVFNQGFGYEVANARFISQIYASVAQR